MAHERLRPQFLFDEEKIKQLKQLAPESFEDGKINFETLRQNLGDWAQDEEDKDLEHFGLFWPGKRDARRIASMPPQGTLEPMYGEGLKADGTPDTDGVNDSKNIFIEGENLEVLKILQKSYVGKIKMIYIDPPYNTGNDFVYDDDFTEPLQEYLRRTGQVDEEGKPSTTNKRSDGRFHSKWLSMMYPRLRLARQLLRDDGVIFISIDDNEVHNLKAICNEIFGEENFIADIIWEKRYTRSNDAKMMASLVDHNLFYRKSDSVNFLRESRTEKANSIYNNPDNDPNGPWTSVSYVSQRTKEQRRNLSYAVKHPDGRLIEHESNAWKYSKEQFEFHNKTGRLYWGKDNGQKYPRLKKYLSEVADKGMVPINLWNYKDTGTVDDGTKEVDALLGKDIFDYPKPTSLIIRMMKLSGIGDGDIVLDFFAGSGTLAHSVYRLNKEDDLKIRYICIQIPDPTDRSGNAYKNGYESICQISLTRIRKASASLMPEDDSGFSVFSLRNSRFKTWSNYSGTSFSDLEKNLDLFNQEPLKDGWTNDCLLAEIILIEGFSLSSKKEKLIKYRENNVLKVSDEYCEHSLLICLDNDIKPTTINALELSGNDIFICLDSAISNIDKLRLSDKGLIKTI